MLAFVGYLATDGGVYAPGAPHVSSFEAHDVTVKTGHMLLLLIAIAIPEGLAYTAIAEMMSGESDRKPGDYGIGWRFCAVRTLGLLETRPLSSPAHRCVLRSPRFLCLFSIQDDDLATQAKYKEAEITHCRAAMLGFAGMVTQSAKLAMEGQYSGFPYVGDIDMAMS